MGQTVQLNLRLDAQVVQELEAMARRNRVTRTELVRNILLDGLCRRRLDSALERYREGEITLERAAMEAGLPLYDMMDEAARRGIRRAYTAEEIRQDAESLLRQVEGRRRMP